MEELILLGPICALCLELGPELLLVRLQLLDLLPVPFGLLRQVLLQPVAR